MDTDLGRTLRWIEKIAQFYVEEWQETNGNKRVTINIDHNYISTYGGGIGITFDGNTGKFIGFEVYE